MKAAVLEEQNKIVVKEVQNLDIDDDTILIKVKACGVCGSDIRIYKGGDKRVNYPIIIGHEITGIIEKVGKNIQQFTEGDRVSASPGHACLNCTYCKNGQENVCINPFPSIGYAINGGYAEYFIIPAHLIKAGFVNKLPDNLTFEQATLAEPLACCLNAHRHMDIKQGDTVLIFGAGPVGCIHTKLSQINNASKVFLADLDSNRLELAKKFSPTKTINPTQENLKEIIMAETNNIGVDKVFVCAPSKKAQTDGLDLLAPKGKINFFGGLAKNDSKIEIDSNLIHYKELIITGTSSSTAQDNKDLVELDSCRGI